MPRSARTWKYRALLESRELRRGSPTTPGTLPRSLFQPDILLRCQWDDRCTRAGPARGAYRLWLRVLADGIQDYLRPKPHASTLAWFARRGPGLGSFDFLCDLFGLDADAVRNALQARRREVRGSARSTTTHAPHAPGASDATRLSHSAVRDATPGLQRTRAVGLG